MPVDIKDVERNHAIVSFTPCTPEVTAVMIVMMMINSTLVMLSSDHIVTSNSILLTLFKEGNGLLVTFRCQANATRMDVKVVFFVI